MKSATLETIFLHIYSCVSQFQMGETYLETEFEASKLNANFSVKLCVLKDKH